MFTVVYPCITPLHYGPKLSDQYNPGIFTAQRSTRQTCLGSTRQQSVVADLVQSKAEDGNGDNRYPSGLTKPVFFTVEDTDVDGMSKMRLDAFISQNVSGEQAGATSRARVQASIKEGLVSLNGKVMKKPSHAVKIGDQIECVILGPPPLEANPENIPLDIVYEDEDVIVVNKGADMVMHPSPGHCSGTMVNALLYHCELPAVKISPEGEDTLLDDEEEPLGGLNSDRFVSLLGALSSRDAEGSGEQGLKQVDGNVVRPGIVHRLDKGTTGLVVIAKTDAAHASLSAQFKNRSVDRIYHSISIGVPRPTKGIISTNVGRDFRDRKKMAAFAYGCTRGKMAKSNYSVLETLASGNAALVSWKLDTGRTHQIRVHAKHIKHPLLADDTYGGSASTAARAMAQGSTHRASIVQDVAQRLNRPALHAKTLGFEHPSTGKWLQFECSLPDDFSTALSVLRNDL
eukprot:jgi/Picsp_1/1879/NSC_05345-R1_rna pseudourine synthase chloroplastic-like